MSNETKLLGVQDVTERQDLAAGRFSSWLRRTRSAQKKEDGADVPCGECNACCTSSYFIPIRPEETQTLSRIPRELLFPAPGLPEGNVLLGYDENGHCPMLIDELAAFALELRAAATLIGAVGLQIHQHHAHAELGYWIGQPFWSRGYCTEAARAVVRYGFEELSVQRIYAYCMKCNPASGRVMQKIGMRDEGCLRQHVKKWDVFED